MQQPFLMKRDKVGGHALSVTCGDTSPKGRGKNTTENFLVIPNTLVMNFTAWLSL